MPQLVNLNNEEQAYINDDISFFNINLAREAANYFDKHGEYPYPPPVPRDENDKDFYFRFQQTAAYPEYKAYWDEEERRCREGVIIPGQLLPNGSLKDVHITGNHYSYLNYNQIIHTKTTSYSSKTSEKLHRNKPKFARKVGTINKYFPDFWDGDYHYYHALLTARNLGMNLVVDKTRQVGYSYKNACLARDEALFVPKSTTVLSAYSDLWLNQGDAIYVMTQNAFGHIDSYTDFKKNYINFSSEQIRIGYRYQGEKEVRGYDSKIFIVTFRGNPRAATGKKPQLLIVEEAGKAPDLIDFVTASNAGLREGDISTGVLVIFGTGGGKFEDFEDFERIFYQPLKYHCLPFKNIWDEAMESTTCGFFHPRYMNLKPYYDENGNSNIEQAMKVIKERRVELEADGDVELLQKNMAEEPISPRESFMASNVNIFYSKGFIEHIQRVKFDPEYNFQKNGLILDINGILQFRENKQLQPDFVHPEITKYKRSSRDDVNGCITIYEYPYKDELGTTPEHMYYLAHDPFAEDTDEEDMTVKHSLGATYVYENVNNFTNVKGDRIVAKYIGRPDQTDTYNENLFKLAKYYNASDHQLWFERNRGRDVINYGKRLQLTHMMCLETEFDNERAITGTKTPHYGINITTTRYNSGLKYLKEWLYSKRGYGEDGKMKYNYHYVFDPYLLEHLRLWNPKAQRSDAIAAMIVLMFATKHIITNFTYPQDVHKYHNNQTQGMLNPDYLLNRMGA